MKKVFMYLFLLSIFIFQVNSVTEISSCQDLSEGLYILTKDIRNIDYQCFRLGNNVTLDCNGYTIEGKNKLGSVAITNIDFTQMGEFNTNIGIFNCSIEKFDIGIHIKNYYDIKPEIEFLGIGQNVLENNNYGVRIDSSKFENLISNGGSNNIYINNLYGLYIFNSKFYTEGESEFYSNIWPITIDNNHDSSIFKSKIYNNTYGISIMSKSVNNYILENSFANNTLNLDFVFNGGNYPNGNIFTLNQFESRTKISSTNFSKGNNDFFDVITDVGNYWSDFSCSSTKNVVGYDVCINPSEYVIDFDNDIVDPAPMFYESDSFSVKIIDKCMEIDKSGKYLLEEDVSATSDCIIINTDDVEIDCQGFSIKGKNKGNALFFNNTLSVKVNNCHISDFKNATYLDNVQNISFENVTISNNNIGIVFNMSKDINIINSTIFDNNLNFNYVGMIENECSFIMENVHDRDGRVHLFNPLDLDITNVSDINSISFCNADKFSIEGNDDNVSDINVFFTTNFSIDDVNPEKIFVYSSNDFSINNIDFINGKGLDIINSEAGTLTSLRFNLGNGIKIINSNSNIFGSIEMQRLSSNAIDIINSDLNFFNNINILDSYRASMFFVNSDKNELKSIELYNNNNGLIFNLSSDNQVSNSKFREVITSGVILAGSNGNRFTNINFSDSVDEDLIITNSNTSYSKNNIFCTNYFEGFDNIQIDYSFDDFENNFNCIYSKDGDSEQLGNYWGDLICKESDFTLSGRYICLSPSNYTIDEEMNYYDIYPLTLKVPFVAPNLVASYLYPTPADENNIKENYVFIRLESSNNNLSRCILNFNGDNPIEMQIVNDILCEYNYTGLVNGTRYSFNVTIDDIYNQSVTLRTIDFKYLIGSGDMDDDDDDNVSQNKSDDIIEEIELDLDGDIVKSLLLNGEFDEIIESSDVIVNELDDTSINNLPELPEGSISVVFSIEGLEFLEDDINSAEFDIIVDFKGDVKVYMLNGQVWNSVSILSIIPDGSLRLAKVSTQKIGTYVLIEDISSNDDDDSEDDSSSFMDDYGNYLIIAGILLILLSCGFVVYKFKVIDKIKDLIGNISSKNVVNGSSKKGKKKDNSDELFASLKKINSTGSAYEQGPDMGQPNPFTESGQSAFSKSFGDKPETDNIEKANVMNQNIKSAVGNDGAKKVALEHFVKDNIYTLSLTQMWEQLMAKGYTNKEIFEEFNTNKISNFSFHDFNLSVRELKKSGIGNEKLAEDSLRRQNINKQVIEIAKYMFKKKFV